MQNKEPIPGFALTLIDFSGDIDSVIGRLFHTAERLGKNYSNLSLIQVDDTLQLFGVKITVD